MIADPEVEYLGRCDELRGDAGPLLRAFDETRAPLSYRKFARIVGREAINSLEQRYGTLAGNFTIRCFTGRYDGCEVVCLMHSGYHHLWALGSVQEANNDAPLPSVAGHSMSAQESSSKWVEMPPESSAVYISARGEQERLRACYVSDERIVASSRLVPANAYSMPALGTWRADDFKGVHGHELAQLQCVPVSLVGLVEEDWSQPQYAMQAGKAEDARRYARWIQEGNIPPPVEIVETDRGGLQLAGDGHRRLAAHKLAGCSHIFAWLSPCMDHPQGLRRDGTGSVLRVGMTYEGVWGKSFRSELGTSLTK